jgi:hypothetical protein
VFALYLSEQLLHGITHFTGRLLRPQEDTNPTAEETQLALSERTVADDRVWRPHLLVTIGVPAPGQIRRSLKRQFLDGAIRVIQMFGEARAIMV